MVRWILEIDSDFNVPVKVEIEDSEYSGDPIPVKGGNPSVRYRIGSPNSDPLEKIKGGDIQLKIAGQKGDYEDLFTRDLSRFKISLYIDGGLESEFMFLPDTFEVPDVQNADFGAFVYTLKGANLSVFKQKQVGDIVSDGSRMAAIEDIISTYFDTPVEDGTVYYPTEAVTGGSSLSQQNIQASRLEDMSCYEALEFLIPKGMQYRMTKGKVIIVPVTEASFTGYTAGGSSTLYDDNFVETRIGRVLETSRNNLTQYDGVRRTYNPLDADNIVPSGDFELEDFSLNSSEQTEFEDEGEVQALPDGWTPVRGVGFNTFAVINGSSVSWKIPESSGSFYEQSTLEANGIDTHESWTAEAGQVLAGERLKIVFRHNYESVNRFAHIPIKIKVGSQVLFRGRNINGNLVAGSPVWREESAGLSRHVDHVLVGTTANTGYNDWEFITPPIPETGVLSVEVETPSVDRSWEPGNNFLEIAEFSIDPANEAGEILTERDTLAGSEGDVYEYTEGFGDGFSSFNPGALFVDDGEISFTPNPLFLTDFWVYDGNDGNVPATQLPLSELETKYLASFLTKANNRISGRTDVYDFLALIDGKRVNHIDIDFWNGVSTVELIEIRDHDLTATIEDRKKKRDGGPIRTTFPPGLINYYQTNAIGELTESIENEQRTEIGVEIDQPLRVGIEYWIINENELSREDRRAGIYSIDAQATDSGGNPVDDDTEGAILQYGPGLLDGTAADKLPIQEQLINAPRGSLIVKAPGQQEVEDNVFQERIDEANENLDNLNNVELPALQAALDDLNNVQLPALQDDLDQLESDLNTLNTVTLPGLESDLQDLNNELDDILPITETKIADDAISTPKLQTNAVTAGKIAADAVIANKIAAGAVTAIKIDTDAVTANKIAAGAVIAGKIGADAVVANNIAADAVTTNKIQAGAITTSKIGANQVTANKIDVDDLAANSAFISELFAQNITFTGKISRTISSQDIIIGANLNAEKLNRPQALFGFATSGGVPFAHVRSDSNNFVEMVGRDGVSSDPFFQVVSGGSTVFKVDRGGSWSINNTGGDFDIAEDGIAILTGNEVLERSIVWRDTLPSGTLRAELTTASSPNRFLVRSSNGYEMALIGDGDTLLRSVNGNVELDPVSGYLIAIGLPTSNPGGTNRIWNDGGTLKIT